MTRSATPPPQVSATRAHAPHLYEVDMVRLLTFACVIAVHVTSRTTGDGDVGLRVFLGMLHFTRQTFFALSAFVLTYSYSYNPRPMRQFWPRRFLLVGVPYLTWSTIYFVYGNLTALSHGLSVPLVVAYGKALATGQAWGHMYFLLVTMQLYLLFPLLRLVVARTRGHHIALLLGTGALQMLIYAMYMYGADTFGFLSGTGEPLFISYIFTFTLGAIIAEHRQSVFSWVRTHHGTVAIILICSTVLFLSVFAFNRRVLGYQLYHSGTPLQPVMVLWSMAMGLLFLTLGTVWVDRRRPQSRWDRALRRTSDWSFGIFLIHPLLISLFLRAGERWLSATIAHPWLTLVLYVLVTAGSLLLVAGIRKTPLSLALTGRPMRQEHRQR